MYINFPYNNSCPNCGYCPHCGRKNAQPYSPWGPYWGPYWGGSGNVAGSTNDQFAGSQNAKDYQEMVERFKEAAKEPK